MKGIYLKSEFILKDSTLAESNAAILQYGGQS